MAVNLVRFASPSGACWGVVRGTGVVPLVGDYPTTAALIEHGESDWRTAQVAPLRSTRSNFFRPSLRRAGSFARAPIIAST